MPNELKICFGCSTPNLSHPADHYTPQRADPLHVGQEGNGRQAYRRLLCLAKAARVNPALSMAITLSSLRGHQQSAICYR
jgi:hypothetical protein